MSTHLVTPAVALPLSLADAKMHLRVTHNLEDSYITGLIAVATAFLQNQYSMSFGLETWELRADCFCGDAPVVIGRVPLSVVDSVKYIDHNGVEQTMPPEDYVADTASWPGRIYPAYGKQWPSARRERDAVRIRFKAGYVDAAAVPVNVIHALKLVIGHFYANREQVSDAKLAEMPVGVMALMSAYKQWVF